ncbi:MAG: MtdA bifunctional protein [Gemmatales bacterium]|nr:MAG: MtdA bifunctional protein [Gemmatales bacterium]
MERRTILVQIDCDPLPSVFDRVVAVDAGVEEIFSYGGVRPEQVRDLVHGAIFTRGVKHLKRTALFIGGSNVEKAEELFDEARRHMLPDVGLRVSILFDANGCSTTSAAAVYSAAQHLDLSHARALVLGGTGPVGQRVARLLARQGSEVRIASRKLDRAMSVCEAIRQKVNNARVEPVETSSSEGTVAALSGRNLVIAAGAAGVRMLTEEQRNKCSDLRVAIDLNAVPPLGMEGVDYRDHAVLRNDAFCYGAIGIGATKMKIHKAAISRLFQSNDQVLDVEEVYELAASL